MEDSSDSSEGPTPAEDSTSQNTGLPVQLDSTVLAEVIPGVAVVFGDIPADLEMALIDFGLVPAPDREQIASVIASIGSATTMVGNAGTAMASMQGFYRLKNSSQALLNAGGKLAAKDGANLGTILLPDGGLAQARFIPVSKLNIASKAAALGPALAMIALQMQLSEVAGLVKTNIALTSQVLTSIRNEQWAELTGLVATIDRAINQAREIESVPTSLWDSVASSGPALRKQLDLYRRNVHGHIEKIAQGDSAEQRTYLQTNAEAIVFDTNALLSSLKAWTGHQALRAATARSAGRHDPDEARLAEVLARDTRAELKSSLDETRLLVDSLTRELRIVAELPGRDPRIPSLPGLRRNAKAAQHTSAQLLSVLEPLADAFRPPVGPLEAPPVLCVSDSLDLELPLRILRWFLNEDETVRALGFADQVDARGPISTIVDGARGRLAAVMNSTTDDTLIAVTDQRIIVADTDSFRERGELQGDIPLEDVRYVRAAVDAGASGSAVDLITREENLRWIFHADIDTTQVKAFASELAESMDLPDAERDELRGWLRRTGEMGRDVGPSSIRTSGADATVSITE